MDLKSKTRGKKAEGALEESFENYHRLFDTMDEGVAICGLAPTNRGRRSTIASSK
jgi:hypothetical protein